ncbi:MAG: TIGR03087 family PEP-CTERM/XrtA system glycosyltransferase [Phycisphaerae bacterium]
MKPRKKILFLTNRLPFPPDKGDKIRTYHQLTQLADSHDVWCACFADTPEDVARADELQRRCRSAIVVPWNRISAIPRTASGWLSGRPFTEAAFTHPFLAKRLGALGRRIQFDSVVAFSSMMARQALAVPARRHVLDLCDVDSEKWFDYARASRFPLSSLCHQEGRRLRAWEHACLNRFDATLVITERERALLDPSARRETLHVIPNGVTLNDDQALLASQCGPVIGFLGVMDYRPNVEGVRWFVRHAWPKVLRECPNARMLIVGRRPVRGIRQLAKLPGVEVTGEVRDVRPYLTRCRVIVVPLHIARGLQNKVLEAMAARRPVVATSAVAAGLHPGQRRPVLTADDPSRFAMKVVDLCRFDGLCQQVADAGHRFVATHYNWSEAMQLYDRRVLGVPIEELSDGMHRFSTGDGMPRRSAGMVCKVMPKYPPRRAEIVGESDIKPLHATQISNSKPDITSVQAQHDR